MWKCCDIFKVGIKRTCGKGDSVRFWLDPWIEEIPLAHSFPKLFEVAPNKNCPVSSQFASHQGNRIWRIRLIGSLPPSLETELSRLLDLLNSYLWHNEVGLFRSGSLLVFFRLDHSINLLTLVVYIVLIIRLFGKI